MAECERINLAVRQAQRKRADATVAAANKVPGRLGAGDEGATRRCQSPSSTACANQIWIEAAPQIWIEAARLHPTARHTRTTAAQAGIKARGDQPSSSPLGSISALDPAGAG